MAKKVPVKSKTNDTRLQVLTDHYVKGTQDMEMRKTRKNGWDDVVNAYMGKLPPNWPYNALITDPRLRTTILEKTSRLLNSKLQGRLVPRESGDIIKARINNAILDFQWDYADEGGAMIEKVAYADQVARLFGAAFAFVYWDTKKQSNEVKIIDSRDVFIDPAASHIKNAKWAQIREYTTYETLERRGYDVKGLKKMVEEGQGDDRRSNAYIDMVRSNRGIEDRTGTDIAYTTFEVVTEWTPETCSIFLPKYGKILKDGKNPYKHGEIPLAMLRYYPLGDDIYGESEAEVVLPLQRAINAILCGFIDEINLSIRPPIKIAGAGVRHETLEYGPGAKWIMNDMNQVQELQMGQGSVVAFNNTYPALIAAFNTAMGDQSLGVSNIKGYQTDKTATEVVNMEKQQNNRDQYNQTYLSQFLKDIMHMWLANNKQYLFSDPTKHYQVVRIVGKDKIRELETLGLAGEDVPDEVMAELRDIISDNPEMMDEAAVQKALRELTVPANPVILNPNDDPSVYDVRKKLEPLNGYEAELYLTPEDLDGAYDYVPDVKSMATGAGVMAQNARHKAMEMILNPQLQAMLQTKGEMLDIKEVVIGLLEDAGYKDAESLFESTDEQQSGQGGVIPGGPTASGPVGPGGGVPGGVPLEGDNSAVPYGPGAGGIPQA